nr:MAG TPA: Repressor protein CI [Caudoviricetes sp.]
MPKKSSLNNIQASTAEDIITRMCVAAKVANRNQLAKVLDIAPNVIAGWITRGSVPYKWVHFIADKFDSSFDFIQKGYTLDADEITKDAVLDDSENPIKYPHIHKPIKKVYIAMPQAYDALDDGVESDNIGATLASKSIVNIDNEKSYNIKKITTYKASAGGGNEIDDIKSYETGELMPISRAFFKTQPKKELNAIEISGESMMPMLHDGDWVIFCDDGEFRGDGLYVVNFSGQLMAKVLQLSPKGELKIISVNPNFKSYEIDINETQEHFRIIGKVIKSII